MKERDRKREREDQIQQRALIEIKPGLLLRTQACYTGPGAQARLDKLNEKNSL